MFNYAVVKVSICALVMMLAVIGTAEEGVEDTWTYPEGGNLGGKSKSGEYMLSLPKAADDTLKTFCLALKAKDYAMALSLCSETVRNARSEYTSDEAFITVFIPVEAVSKLTRTPIYGQTSSYKEPGDGVIGVKCFVDYEELQWNWEIKKSGQRWEIDFRPRPVKEWAATVREYYKRKEAVNKERRDALEKHLHQFRTRLTAAKSNVKIGKPILVGLVLHNDSPADLVYDASGIGLNDSITVLDSEGNTIPYSADLFQTVMNNEDIKAGSKAILLESFDVASQYAISKPGEYRIRFNGNGLSIGRWFVYEQFEIDYSEKVLGKRMYRKSDVGYSPNEFPSNTVTVTVEQ